MISLPKAAIVAATIPTVLLGQYHTFSGFVYPAANNVPTDSGPVAIVNPSNDTIWTKIGQDMDNFYTRTSDPGWIYDGDTVKVSVADTTGQTASTFRIVKPTANYLTTLFPGGHAFVVNKVWDSVDSVDAKCWVKGKPDTLNGRFRIGIPDDDIYFNRGKFLDPPALNDSIIFEISEGSLYARTGCKYERALWDADSAPSCSLNIVGIGENLENKVQEPFSLIKTNPVTNGILNLNQKGNFVLYNAAGSLVKKANGDKINVKTLPSGAYFLFTKPKDSGELLYKPEKVVIMN
ncbi:MAG: T9SS type A sorting domain-containing protein [Candidatus Pacearchaeota archaeon]|nr:MAG: T9SS type A sorting domain-containing protein [Candidatus Pacearchaeota archaeon]